MIGCPLPPCSTMPPRRYGSPAARAAAAVSASPTIGSSIRWVTSRPLYACRRNGKNPSTMVCRWNIRNLPTRSDELPMPLRSRSRGVSNAPHATTTASAVTVCSTPSPSRYRTPRDRRRAASSRISSGDALGTQVAAAAFAVNAAASPPDRPWRRSGSRRRRRTRSCCTPGDRRTERCWRRSARGTGGTRAARAAGTVSVVRNMSAPGGIGYGPLRQAANGLPVWSPATPMRRSASE